MTVTSAKTARAARAGEAIVARHAELREVLDHWAGALAAAANNGGPIRPVRNLLRAFLADEVLPHARAEERTLYRAASHNPDATLLVRALTGDHRVLASRVAALSEPASPAAIAAEAAVISALFASHVAKEDRLLLPAMERAGTDLAALLAREPRLAGSQCAALHPGRGTGASGAVAFADRRHVAAKSVNTVLSRTSLSHGGSWKEEESVTITGTEAYEAMRTHHRELGEQLAERADAVSDATAVGHTMLSWPTSSRTWPKRGCPTRRDDRQLVRAPQAGV